MNITRTAVVRLTLSTAAWGLSFPTAKAVMQAQMAAAPGHAGWFHAALILFNRMLLATLIMLALIGARRRGFTRLEVRQGIELGLFGGLGMLLQTDAQNHIAASTSAFFTQFTCIFVPLTVALRSRRMPSPFVVTACVLDVYLYPGAGNADLRATYAEARRASDGKDVDRAACVTALRQHP